MQKFVSLLVLLLFVFSASLALAQPSDSTLSALTDKVVQITTSEGVQQGVVIGFDDQSIIVADRENNVVELSREGVEGVRLVAAGDASSKATSASTGTSPSASNSDGVSLSVSPSVIPSDVEQRRELHAHLLQERREVERTGLGLRIPGGIITGAGGIVAFASLVNMAVEGVHYEWVSSGERGRDTLRTGVITSTVVGMGMAAAGVGLIVAGNKQRKRAIDAYEKSLSYSISPSFNAKGGGATLELKF